MNSHRTTPFTRLPLNEALNGRVSAGGIVVLGFGDAATDKYKYSYKYKYRELTETKTQTQGAIKRRPVCNNHLVVQSLIPVFC